MNVLDPFEVADIEVYPFYDLEKRADDESEEEYRLRMKETLATAEYSVFQKVLKASKLGAVLNEADISPREIMELPPSFRGRIIPDDLFALRQHPDVRIARRASTIASLAKVIGEREVSGGLRRTLLTQARRLELLVKIRLADFATEIPEEQMGEETGDTKK